MKTWLFLKIVGVQLFCILILLHIRHLDASANTNSDPQNVQNNDPEDKSNLPRPNKTHVNLEEDLQTHRTAELKYFQKQFVEAFKILDQPCNFKVYNETMLDFWTEMFKGTSSEEENDKFNQKFWNVYLKCDESKPESNVTVQGRCGDEEDPVIDCTANCGEQIKRQKDLCFTGGLIECGESSGKCECMNTIGTTTERVDPDSGKPDPKGFGCFVKVGEVCRAERYDSHPLVFPCVNHGICNDFTSKCENLDKVLQ